MPDHGRTVGAPRADADFASVSRGRHAPPRREAPARGPLVTCGGRRELEGTVIEPAATAVYGPAVPVRRS